MRTKVLLTGLLVCLMAGSFALSARAASARALVSKGNQAYAQHRYQEALSSYEAAAKVKPDSPQIWFNKGDALYQIGRAHV